MSIPLDRTQSLKLTRAVRVGMLLLCYAAGLAFSLILAYLLRFDFVISAEYQRQLWVALLWVLPIKLLLLYSFRQFAGLLSFSARRT